jgi:hypothetical protein
MTMFRIDPTSQEVIRYLATFDAAAEILTSFKETEATFQEGIRRLEEVRDQVSTTREEADRAAGQIRKAVLEAKEAANWDRLVAQLSDAVYYNGYVALEKLVDNSLESSVEKIKALLQETTAALDTSIENLQAAVVGKPPLPIAPPGSSATERALVFTRSIWVRFRRWCVDAVPVVAVGCFILALGCFILLGYIALRVGH